MLVVLHNVLTHAAPARGHNNGDEVKNEDSKSEYTIMASAHLTKFDPTDHMGNLYDAFCEFIDSFRYEYEAIAKPPPAGTEDVASWTALDKRKVAVSSRNTSLANYFLITLNLSRFRPTKFTGTSLVTRK